MTMDFLVDAALAADLTTIYTILVWMGAILAVAWMAAISDDPVNKGVAAWMIHARRLGVIMFQGGLLLNSLIGSRQGWAPWPGMLLIALGADLYYGASLLAYRARLQSRSRAAVHAALWPYPTGPRD